MIHSLPGFVIIRPSGQMHSRTFFERKEVAEEFIRLTGGFDVGQACAIEGLQIVPCTATFNYQLPITKQQEQALEAHYEGLRIG